LQSRVAADCIAQRGKKRGKNMKKHSSFPKDISVMYIVILSQGEAATKTKSKKTTVVSLKLISPFCCVLEREPSVIDLIQRLNRNIFRMFFFCCYYK